MVGGGRRCYCCTTYAILPFIKQAGRRGCSQKCNIYRSANGRTVLFQTFIQFKISSTAQIKTSSASLALSHSNQFLSSTANMHTGSSTQFLLNTFTTLLLITSATTTLAQQTSSTTDATHLSDSQVHASPTTISSWSSWSYENAFTIYTTQTDSLGVITGRPAVVTSQPEVVTSQPPVATNPTLSGYWYGNSTTTTSSISQTSSAQSTTLATSTTATTVGSSGSRSGTAAIATATGGAVSNQVAGAGLALVVLGLGFSML